MNDLSHFDKLSKNKKEGVLFRTTQDLERWLEVGDYVSYVSLYDDLCEITHEGYGLDERAVEILLHPIKKWGMKYGRVLHEMRVTKWEQSRHRKAVDEAENRIAARDNQGNPF